MQLPRSTLRIVYWLIGAMALVGTWGHNLQYLHLGPLGGTIRFWTETLANPASRSITVDIFLLGLAATTWMLLEARRLGMRLPWLYVVLGLLVAISLTFPIFLANRERVLALRENSASAGDLRRSDVFGLAMLAVLSFAYVLLSFYQCREASLCRSPA